MIEKDNNILRENFEYFKANIEPYYFLLYNTKNQAIVVEVGKENLSHLLGIKKSSNALLASMNAFEVYNYLMDNENVSSVFEIVNYERYSTNQLSLEEEYILDKNIYFIDIFESFIPEYDIRIYKHIDTNVNEFKADYLHVKHYDIGKGYLGIIGSSIDDYHFFNSIRYDKDYEIKGVKYLITRIEKIPKKDFYLIEDKIQFVKSRRNINNMKSKKTKKNTGNIEYQKILKYVNKKLPNGYEMKVGEFSKKSVQIYHNKKLLEPHFENKLHNQSTKEIVEYIIKEYVK